MIVPQSLKTPLSAKIADSLREDIIAGILKDEEHLNEAALAKRFGVSRGPIRSAMSILENEGRVQTLPSGRTIVVGFCFDELKDYYKVRLYIEKESIKTIFSQERNDDFQQWLDSLEQTIEDSKRFLSSSADDIFVEYDMVLHRAIVERSKSRILIQIWKTLNNFSRSIHEMNRLYLSGVNLHDQEETYQAHLHILQGLRENDYEFAINSLSKHIDLGVQTFERIVENVIMVKAKE